MRKRLIPILLLVIFVSCAFLGTRLGLGGEPAPLPHEGVWYFAGNAVECRVADGKIYQDDPGEAGGQSLRGVYTEKDGYLEAHLMGVGGVRDTHRLYVSQTDLGQVLSERPAGRGTIYFYRDPVEAMAALEEAAPASGGAVEPSAPAASDGVGGEDVASPAPAESAAPTSGESAAPSSGDTVSGGASEAPSPAAPGPSSAPAAPETGDGVWVSQSGSKYHRDPTCSGMKSPTQMSKAQAESQGYTPCKRCY